MGMFEEAFSKVGKNETGAKVGYDNIRSTLRL